MSSPDKPSVQKSEPTTSQVEPSTTTEQPETVVEQTAPVAATPKATPAPAAVPAPSGPVVVTAFREIVIDEKNSDCEYTYSDGSKSTFRWKTWNPQAAQVNGQWSGANQFSGVCDDTALGQPKA